MEFRGTVKPRRRGGWIARAVLVEQRFGQLVETQIGPKELPDQPTCVVWLTDAAVRFGAGQPKIVTLAGSGR